MSDLTGTKGGSGVWQRIISEMPEHDVYIEPFWGRGTIAKAKRPALHTIGLDLDPDALSDGVDVGALMFRTDAIQWLKDYFRLSPIGPDAESYVSRSTIAGSRAARSSRNQATGDGEPAATAAASCGPVRNAVSSVTAATFGGVDVARHFVYLDPPYVGCSGYYRHELTIAQHIDLCRVFLALPCPAALSGYFSREYAAELDGKTRLVKIPTVNRAGRRVTEHLWLNFDPPLRYHDVRFVGIGRRERERIRRRVKNWREGLARLPVAERQAVYEACSAVFGDVPRAI